MAITRTQIARQLYKDGKRVGFFTGAQADTRAQIVRQLYKNISSWWNKKGPEL